MMVNDDGGQTKKNFHYRIEISQAKTKQNTVKILMFSSTNTKKIFAIIDSINTIDDNYYYHHFLLMFDFFVVENLI